MPDVLAGSFRRLRRGEVLGALGGLRAHPTDSGFSRGRALVVVVLGDREGRPYDRIWIRALVIVFSSLLRRVLGSSRTVSFCILGKIGGL